MTTTILGVVVDDAFCLITGMMTGFVLGEVGFLVVVGSRVVVVVGLGVVGSGVVVVVVVLVVVVVVVVVVVLGNIPLKKKIKK